MKRFVSLFVAIIVTTLSISAQTRVIAHRGYWNCEGSFENSITSLREAAKIGAWGSEFDVVMSRDGVLVINHDDDINGVDIQSVEYAQIQDQMLPNGERLPTLREYLKEGKRFKKLKLIFEMKPHRTKEVEDRAVVEALKIIRELGIEQQVEFISFSLNICKEFAAASSSPVCFLGGDIRPKELALSGIDGVDYHYNTLLKDEGLIEEAASIGAITNSWTVNNLSVAQSLIGQGIGYLTTDYPEEVMLLVERLGRAE